VHNEEDADISVAWVRDYGTHILGESIFAAHIKVGLGSTNCVGQWMAFDANTVKKILWHELGHSMGYGHSDDENNIMYKSAVTRFEVDQEVSEVIAGGWYYTIPLCGSGAYYYSFETEDPNAGFELAVLPPGVDPQEFSGGQGRAYSGCGSGSWRSYSGSCAVAVGAVIYIANSSFTDAIRLSGQIIDQDNPPWPDMTWDEEVFRYDDTTLTAFWDLFHN
jgi:hypothetical protein